MKEKYIAQVNIAKMKEPLDSDLMKEFVDFIEPVNRWAEESPGFIWRLKDENGGSSAYVATPFEDDLILNISVWRDIHALKAFTYSTVHSYFIRSGKKWFNKMQSPHLALWWVDTGHVPSIEEAIEKLKNIEENGPGPEAFTFKEVYFPER